MAWIRCCGGSGPRVNYPIDLLQLSWTTSPTTGQDISYGSTKYWNMIGTTPKLKANATIAGTFNNYSINTVVVYVEVSTDGNTWTPVITSAGGNGAAMTASLSAYANQEIYIRLRAYNSNPNTFNVEPVYSPSAAYFIIA